MSGDPIKVAIVADWEQCSRAVHWEREIKQLHVDADCLTIRLAEWVTHRDNNANPASFLRELDKRKVLILNFDSINGDPAFGSDITLAWFRHRHPELLHWVDKGNILIVEGQTMLSVPTQESYDALFGHRELRVSGPSVTPVPGVERARVGRDCQITSKAKAYHLLEGLDSIKCTGNLTLEHFFPGDAKLMLSGASGPPHYDWTLLYRGWFTRVPIFHRRFHWVPLIETTRTDRKVFRNFFNHAVLVGARHKKGVMFMSTMLLAGTGQESLLQRLITWNTDANPLPISERRWPGIVETTGAY